MGWLDKVCIDQTAIADGLRALPVNVMACAKVLLVCGPTYPDRLWCVWELYTLFSFRDVEKIGDCIETLLLESDAYSNIWSKLSTFSVKNAHCFDPNEERILKMVINAVGSDRFNRNVREFAVVHQAQRVGKLSGR